MGMSGGIALLLILEDASSLGEEEAAVMILGLWGLWGGMTTGLNLRLMGILQHLRGPIILCLGWGTVWALTALGCILAADEFNSLACILPIIALGFFVSVALLILVLRLDSVKLSVPRQLLLGLGWLIGGIVFLAVFLGVGIGVFDVGMGMSDHVAAPLSAALGGLVLGSMVAFLMKAVVTGARPKASGPKAKGKSSDKRG